MLSYRRYGKPAVWDNCLRERLECFHLIDMNLGLNTGYVSPGKEDNISAALLAAVELGDYFLTDASCLAELVTGRSNPVFHLA